MLSRKCGADRLTRRLALNLTARRMLNIEN
jgi:hypothetical protein